jgi:hypothetical protein
MHIRRLLSIFIAICLIFTQMTQAYSLTWLPHNHQGEASKVRTDSST